MFWKYKKCVNDKNLGLINGFPTITLVISMSSDKQQVVIDNL